MGTDARQQKVDIVEELLTKSSRFSYVQALRLLRFAYNDEENPLEDKLRTRARLSMEFPNSDIVSIEKDKDFINLYVTFMGLYGESSPLPTFYTEALLEEKRNDKSVMREFIDIFNIPLYQTYFKVWLKNQIGIRLNEFNDSKIENLLSLFCGVPQKNMRQSYEKEFSLLKYAGLNMVYPRSAEALRALISDIIDYDKIEIEQCVATMAPIPSKQFCALGQENSSLDEDLHLGNKIKDRMGKFRIEIFDLDADTFNALLPGGKKYHTIQKSVALYLGNELSWDLKLTLLESVKTSVTLGALKGTMLGMNSWLGRADRTRTVVFDQNFYKDK
jgi:type VI secretion system protein ImpH